MRSVASWLVSPRPTSTWSSRAAPSGESACQVGVSVAAGTGTVVVAISIPLSARRGAGRRLRLAEIGGELFRAHVGRRAHAARGPLDRAAHAVGHVGAVDHDQAGVPGVEHLAELLEILAADAARRAV